MMRETGIEWLCCMVLRLYASAMAAQPPTTPPRIFSTQRRHDRRHRALAMQDRPDAASFMVDEMVADVLERLAFLRHEPGRSLIIGDSSGVLARQLGGEVITVDIAGARMIDLEAPFPISGFDFIAVLGLLDTVNDLPGALIHIRHALSPGGLAITSFPAAGSLPVLRGAIMAAEPDRPAARMHPLVDSRAGAQLLQRAGWKDPVVDTYELTVRYRKMARLVEDLREQGLGNVLASPAPPLGKAALERARNAFMAEADDDGRVSERFTFLTLSGRRSLGGT